MRLLTPALRVVAALATAAVSLGGMTAASAAGYAQPPTWNFTQARIPGAQAAGHDGAGVTVAVVDTWVDGSHPQFGGRVLAGADCVGGCRPGPAPRDPCDHGTHVAGTIASASWGVAPRATIMPVRVLTWDPTRQACAGSTRDVAAAIRWAAAHGAQVINLSLGSVLVPGLTDDTAIPRAVAAAAADGAVVVFAAGNGDPPLRDDYGDQALVVAATGPDGRLASYSQRGQAVTVAAPGGDANGRCTQQTCVLSTWPDGRYALDEGTSMAAAHVAGLAALLLAQHPHRGRANVVHAIEDTARPLPGAGFGLIDATAAMKVLPGQAAHRPAGTAAAAGADGATTVAPSPSALPTRAAAASPRPAKVPATPVTPHRQPSAQSPATSPVARHRGPVLVAALLVAMVGLAVLRHAR